MKQAIITKYFGPTNTKGSRIKATCASGSITFTYAYNMNAYENHQAAALELKAKMGWANNDTVLIAGMTPKDDGFVFVMVETETKQVLA